MRKILFERLTQPQQPFDLRHSVAENIDRILSCGGYLDEATGKGGETGRLVLDSMFRNGLASLVDQSMDNNELLTRYRAALSKVLLRYEPRLKNVTVGQFVHTGLRARCRLKLELVDDTFEQDFEFGPKG